MKLKKLGSKLILLFIILVGSCVIILSGISILSEQKIIHEQLTYSTSEAASSLADEVDTLLTDRMHMLSSVAELSYIKDFTFLSSYDTIKSIQKSYPDFQLLFLADTTGDQFIKSNGSCIGNISEESYFQICISTDAPVISDVITSEITCRPAVNLAVPVHNKDGDLVGILGGTFDLSELEDMRLEYLRGETGYSFITDSAGIALAHPNEEYVISKQDLSNLEIVKEAFLSKEGSLDYTEQGVPIYGSYATVASTGWAVVMRQTSNEAYQDIQNSLNRSLLYGAMILFVAILTGIIFSKFLTAPLHNLAKNASVLSTGDLTKEIKTSSKDEIGQLGSVFEQMRMNLKSLISNLSTAAEEVKNDIISTDSYAKSIEEFSESITTSIHEFAKGTNEQAENVQTAAKAVQNISESIDFIAINSERSHDTSEAASKLAASGSALVTKQNEKIAESTAAVSKVAEIIHSLNANNEEIGEIADVIARVTKQTNLLALNAAIEAARAGEQGKGFAVVAEQVRLLAEESQISTSRIREIVQMVQSTTGLAVERADLASTAIQIQNESIHETSEIFGSIVTLVHEISQELKAITSKTLNVKEESKQILKSMESLMGVSEESAASAEEITAAATEQMDSIRKMVLKMNKLNALADDLAMQASAFKQ